MTWRTDHGWLVVLYAADRRHYRGLPPGTTYRQAKTAMRAMLKEDPAFEKAWLIRKEQK